MWGTLAMEGRHRWLNKSRKWYTVPRACWPAEWVNLSARSVPHSSALAPITIASSCYHVDCGCVGGRPTNKSLIARSDPVRESHEIGLCESGCSPPRSFGRRVRITANVDEIDQWRTKFRGRDHDIGIVGKCLRPTTSKGPTKDGCKIFLTYVSQSVTNVLCIVNTKLSIFALNINFT